MAMTEEERKCPKCGAVVDGRSDKVYCSGKCKELYRRGNRTPEDRKKDALRMRKRRSDPVLRDKENERNRSRMMKYRAENPQVWAEYYKKNKERLLANNRKYREDNAGRIKARKQAYREKNKENIKNYNQKYRESHRHELKAMHKENVARMVAEISTPYVKHLICSHSTLTRKDIPQSLIDAKREHLKIKRFLKEQENEQKET
jgi:predicted nucleic acid-binding Zn ribbon protein